MDRRTARAERSKSALKAAFLDLFQSREPADISVVALCEKAGLNRSTFYAHFTDIPDMFEQTEAILSAQLRECYPEELAGKVRFSGDWFEDSSSEWEDA